MKIFIDHFLYDLIDEDKEEEKRLYLRNKPLLNEINLEDNSNDELTDLQKELGKDEILKLESAMKNKLRKLERMKSSSKANFTKLSLFEKNMRLSEMAKEIKVIKAQNRYLTRRCLHLSAVLKLLK